MPVDFIKVTPTLRTRHLNNYNETLSCGKCGKKLKLGSRVWRRIRQHKNSYYCESCEKKLRL